MNLNLTRKGTTKFSTVALVVMSVIYAVVGFTTADKSVWQILALTATLGIFSWLLSETLETYLQHRAQNNWRQHTAMLLGSFLLATEIHLVHFGMGWMFSELGDVLLYMMSAGFSAMTLLAKATFAYEYPEETQEEPAIQAEEPMEDDKLEDDLFETLVASVEDATEVVGKSEAA